jgi:hypothetical protein
MIYCIFITPFLFFAIVELCDPDRKHLKLVLFFFIVVLILFIGLRYKTGADWAAYIKFFESIPQNGKTEFEPGYAWLNRIIYYSLGNYFAVQFIATFVLIYAYYKFIKKHAQFPIFSLCLFFFFFFTHILMCQVRQSIAMGIILLGAENVFERKFIKYLLYVFAASLFHISAVFAIPVYFLYNYFGKPLPIFLVFFCTLSYFYHDAVYFLLAKITPFLPGRLGFLAARYLNSEIFTKTAEFGTGLGYTARLLMVVFIVCICKNRDKKTWLFINCLVMAQMISSVAIGFYIVYRLQSYYLMFGILGYENLFRSFSFKKVPGLFYAYLCMVILFFSLPFFKERTSHKYDELTGRDAQYSSVPYYNVFYHPYEADLRKDWNE